MTDTTSAPEPAPKPGKRLFATRGWRFATMILLTLLMGIPLMMIAFIIEDRAAYQRDAVRDVSQQWGGPIHLAGPLLVIPVETQKTQMVKQADGSERRETYTVRAEPLILLPETLEITADSVSEIRRRGIFDVPVYAADLQIRTTCDPARVAGPAGPRERVLWDKAVLTVLMPRTRSFSGAAVLKLDGAARDLEPGSPFRNQAGIQAHIGDPRGLTAASLTMGLNGAGRLAFQPVGRQTDVRLTSDWPHPSFTGAFLPKPRDVTADGFTARWTVPHLARDLPQVSRGGWQGAAEFGVRFYSPVDFYQKVQRAAKYGILFIALTFLTVFLIEKLAARPAHAAQLVLIGIAQCIFFLLLLSFSEQIGFTPAYAVAGAATIGLIAVYGRAALGLGRATWILLGALTALYATLYLILRSTDYALLAGSILSFIAVALAMTLTRGDDWSGTGARPAAPAQPA